MNKNGLIRFGLCDTAKELAQAASDVNCVVIGPGMTDEMEAAHLLRNFLCHLQAQPHQPTLVLDAAAFTCLSANRQSLHPFSGKAIITPHALEMSLILGIDKSQVLDNPQAMVQRAANDLQAIVALKGAETLIASPNSSIIYSNRNGNVGLATSGSGDTLAGIVGGLAARGAEPQQALAWAVYLHARAGEVLAQKLGHLGYLAREIPAEIPALMSEFDQI